MIHGIGVDIVKIERMKDSAEKWGRKFLDRIFTEKEIAYCFERKNPYPSLSVRFAAKEALIKAIGAEIPVSLTDIEIMTYGNGRPYIRVKGKLKSFFEEKSIKKVHLSLSHERDYGVASVVIEGEQ